MGRPNKNNAEYFSHDADMRNDVKVKALRRRFSHTGYAVWNYILETLTDTENFEIDFREVNKELLAADFDVTVQELNDIVGYACKIDLLQTSEDGSVLFSAAHKRRFSQLLERRAKLSEAGKKGMAKRWSSNNPDITPDKDVITPDSKEKESKAKESKGKQREINYPYQDIADLWNRICSTLPRIKALNDNRRQKIRLRLGEMETDPKTCLDRLKELFERISASNFLCGNNSNGWTATFDWVFENGKNWVKIVEGNYDNDRGSRSAALRGSQTGANLGVGEFIEQTTGRRTYGSGRATIPADAPPRPSERHSWDAASKTWILL